MKVGTTALSYWIFLSSCTSPGQGFGPVCVTSFAPSINSEKVSRCWRLNYQPTSTDQYWKRHGYSQPKWYDGDVVGNESSGSGSTPNAWDFGTSGAGRNNEYARESEARGGVNVAEEEIDHAVSRVDLSDDGVIFDVQALNDNSDFDEYLRQKYERYHNPTYRGVVEAECVDFINAKSKPSKLRDIAKKAGYDTTDMGQEELEKIARWVQSKQFHRMDELREIAEKEGYDTIGMGQEELDKTARWLQSPEYRRSKELREREEYEGISGSGQTKFSSISLEELQAVAYREGYDPTGMDRGYLEQIMDWVHSQDYHEQKQQYSKLRDIAEKGGYDTTNMTPEELEQTAHWAQSQQFERDMEEANRAAGQGPCSGQTKSHGQTKWANGDEVGNNSEWNAKTSGVVEENEHTGGSGGEEGFEVGSSADSVVIDVQAVDDDNDSYDQSSFKSKYQPEPEAVRAECKDFINTKSEQNTSKGAQEKFEKATQWFQSVQAECKDFINTKSEPNKVGEIPEKEGYVTSNGGKDKLEKAAQWLQSQGFQKEEEQVNKNKDRASTGQDLASDQTKYSSVPLEELQAVAHCEGYDPTGMDRDYLEQIVDWVQSKEYHEQKEQYKQKKRQKRNFKPQDVATRYASKSSNRTPAQQGSSWYASASIEDLRSIAYEEGYDINLLDRTGLEKIAEWVDSNEYKQQKQQSMQNGIGAKYASTSLKDLQTTAQMEGYDINGLNRRDLERIEECVGSQELKQEKDRTQQEKGSLRYASTSIQDLQNIAIEEGYDINGLDKRDLEKIAEWVDSKEYKQQKQNVIHQDVNEEYASTSLEDLQTTAQTEGYDINGLDRRDLEKIADWVNCEEYKQQKQKSQVHSAVDTIYTRMSTQDLTRMAHDGGYDTTKIGLGRDDLENIAEWLHPQQQQTSSTASRFSLTSLHDLRTIAYTQGYDINGLERNDLEQIAEWHS